MSSPLTLCAIADVVATKGSMDELLGRREGAFSIPRKDKRSVTLEGEEK